MVSRRNYLTIAMMLLILFFMFQFTGVMKEKLNQYGTNEYETPTKTEWTKKECYQATEDIRTGKDTVIYLGEASEDMGQVVSWWCTYTKRTFISYASLEEYTASGASGASVSSETSGEKEQTQVVVLDGTKIRTRKQIKELSNLTERGISLIFASLPETSVIEKSEDLKELLGIKDVIMEQTTVKGMHLFAGFLLGGEAIYEAAEGDKKEEDRQDMELLVPWYVTGAGTKTYMMGTMEQETLEKNVPQSIAVEYSGMSEENKVNALSPAIIWRNSVSDAVVFCVNGSYLGDCSGVGILDAMMAEMTSYQLYPVVNAQNFVVADYPGFAEENETEMMRRYSQSQQALYREIIWPSLSSLTQKLDWKMTCMMTPQYDYMDENLPKGDEVAYYLKLLKEEHGEAGLCGSTMSEMAVSEKIAEDDIFWKTYEPDYAFLSFYLKNATQLQETLEIPTLTYLRTVVTECDEASAPVISYASDTVTLQQPTGNGKEHTFLDDFQLKCLQNALGYSNVVLDLSEVAYPDEEDASWEKLGKEISSNLVTYWKPFDAFAATTLAESDQRIRRFLALDYTKEREENMISLHIEQFDEQAWFLLRTNGETVTDVAGGSCIMIEKGAYLIEADESEVSITVGQEKADYYSNGQVVRER